MKELGDELVATGVNIGDEELLLYILDGLGPKYDAVVANLTYNSSMASIYEAQFLLHKHEIRLERQNNALTNFHEHLTSALIAFKQGISAWLFTWCYGNRMSHPIEGIMSSVNTSYQGVGFNKSFYSAVPPKSFGPGIAKLHGNMMKGRGRGRGYFKPKLIYQGLLAATCPPHGSLNNSFAGFHDCSVPALTKAVPESLVPAFNTYEAVTTPQTVNDQAWSMDSGASHQMTADGSNLMFKSNYPGCSKVQVGNGESIPITHIGMLLVPSFDTNKVVKFRNILCVPKIAKTLLSISQIARENPVIVEFHTDVCLVKDKDSGTVLL
ncbi:uncharacterized protein LOC116131385 [Pistacia vera]|uniref:uncharacterized protein LOC116131385 n=1 Tax=Pistacia vera TaxID=55513 RepID=UPI00126320AB|nr:uncharacterized protein LOC116131385 [Pistacia vera]